MRIVQIDRVEWIKNFQNDAYKKVFEDDDTSSMDRSLFDHAFVVVDDKTEMPIIYNTIKQSSTDSVFIEFGGSFPEYRGSMKVKPAFKILLDMYKNGGAKVVHLNTKNTNVAMQKLALSTGFTQFGVHLSAGNLFLEYALIFGEGEK